MRRIRTTIQALIGATVIAGGMAALTPAAQAATPVACSEAALVAAVNLANSTPDPDTLTLYSGCIYSMTASHGSATNGQEALPVITTPIDMTGPATITRAASAPPFRIAEVSPTGKLTFTTGVALTNGSAVGLVDGNGGAILNFGAVTLTNSSLSGNTAAAGGGGLANADTSAGTVPTATFTNSPVSNNTALVGGGIFNGRRATLTTTGVSGSPLLITGNRAGFTGGGIAAIDSTSSAKATTTTLTDTTVTANSAGGFGPGGVYRQGGTMTTTNSPITANTPNNCVGSNPAVPNCTG
jgi:hypothetical protein